MAIFPTNNSIFPTNNSTVKWNAPPSEEYLIGKTRGGWKLYRVPTASVCDTIFYHDFYNKKDEIHCYNKSTKQGKRVFCPTCGSKPPKKLLATAILIDPDFISNMGCSDNMFNGIPGITKAVPLPAYPQPAPSTTPTWVVSQGTTTTDIKLNYFYNQIDLTGNMPESWAQTLSSKK